MALKQHHGVPGESLPYKKTKTVGLWLSDVHTLASPVPFFRLRGSCGWASVRYGPRDLQEHQDMSKSPIFEDMPSWPRLEDRILFEPTFTFKPSMNKICWLEATMPAYLQKIVGQEWISARTLGDGACAMHAAFGSVNSDGSLECIAARILAAESLERALKKGKAERHMRKRFVWLCGTNLHCRVRAAKVGQKGRYFGKS